MKKCSKCGQTKPLDEFYFDARNADGRRAACKLCKKTAMCPDRLVRINLREEKSRQHHQTNEARQIEREYLFHARIIQDRLMKELGFFRKCSQRKSKEQKLDIRRKWANENRHKVRLYEHRRKFKVNEPYTIKQVWERTKGRCAYCMKQHRLHDYGTTRTGGTWSIDHIFPYAKGGQNILTNVCVACCGCNHSKKDSIWRPVVEFDQPQSLPEAALSF